MKTIENKIYALILYGKCHWIFTSNELPEYNENDIQVVEIDATVRVGDIYDDSIFTSPPTTNPTDILGENA